METANEESASVLTSGQLLILRQALERLRGELRERLQGEEAGALQAEQLSEPMDAAEQTREQDDAVTFTARDRALLSEIEHALDKFESGRYGFSEASGEPLGFRRLQAIPWARVTADEAEAI